MTTPLKTFAGKTAKVVHDDMLRVLKNALINRGVATPNIGPGSDWDLEATAIGNEHEVLYANQQIVADQQMLDTATGTGLDRIGNFYGLSRRGASLSAGFGTFAASQSSFIAAGQQLIDTQGLRYQVSTGGTYANLAQLPISGVDAGSLTNHISGDVLKWVVAPAYASNSVTINAGGLVGAIDAENDDTYRSRIQGRLAFPPQGGNWAQLAALAVASSTNVQAAFVYPACNGPATVHVCTVTYPTNVAASTAKNRSVDAATMSSVVTPYIQGNIAEYVECNVTTATSQPTSVAIGLSLPASPQASPPGPGGGWLDATPWPNGSDTVTSGTVGTVTSSTVFVVNAFVSPTANVTRVAFLDPSNWTFYTARVLSVSGSTPNWTITIDTPWPNVANGCYVFPQSTNQTTYVAAIMSAFSNMGPGEVTANATVLSRGFRHPLPTLQWPYTTGTTQLKTVISSGSEVLDARYIRGGSQTPNVAGSVYTAPSVLVPANIGFYPY